LRLPVQAVDATPFNQLIGQRFPPVTNWSGLNLILTSTGWGCLGICPAHDLGL
jgi:hypothetical protein